MSTPKILDCTLRDGGYYNDWNFSWEFVDKYLLACQAARVSVVEIGFRFPLKREALGRFAHSPAPLLKVALSDRRSSPFDYAVMINAVDYLHVGGEAIDESLLHMMFPGINDDAVQIVRIAFVFDALPGVVKLAQVLGAKGYKIWLNLMRCGQLENSQLDLASEVVEQNKIEAFCLADSFGGCTPDRIKRLFDQLATKTTVPLGFHGHDNRGLVHANVRSALEAGASWIDSTFYGMGRGPGNAKTEILAAEYLVGDSVERVSEIHSFVSDFIDTYFTKYRWGASAPYVLSANRNIHPTPVQTALDSEVSNPKVLSCKLSSATKMPNEQLVNVFTALCGGQQLDIGSPDHGALTKDVILIPGIRGSGEVGKELRVLKSFGYTIAFLNMPFEVSDYDLPDLIYAANPARLVEWASRPLFSPQSANTLVKKMRVSLELAESLAVEIGPELAQGLTVDRRNDGVDIDSIGWEHSSLNLAVNDFINLGVKRLYLCNFSRLPNFIDGGFEQSKRILKFGESYFDIINLNSFPLVDRSASLSHLLMDN